MLQLNSVGPQSTMYSLPLLTTTFKKCTIDLEL